ncbi:hypothetical protein LZG00_12100 [Rhodobacteraceae bacterium LMO-12]|nr:hypothetical protein [Rhodobacteraceae bacterium LMO-JJ12]
MVDVKRYAIAGGTFACILATGFFMQSGGKTPGAVNTADVGSMGMQVPATDSGEISDIALTSADGQSPADVSPSAQEMAPPATEDMTEAKVTLPDDVAPVTAPVDFAPIQTPDPDEAPVEVSLLVDPEAASDPVGDPVADSREAPQLDAQCDIAMTAEPMTAALVVLELAAPCLPNERLTIHHSGMMFTDTTDEMGNYMTAVPALSQTAVFIASFANGDGTVASTSVPDLIDFDRAVVQSEFESNAGLHALEFGAGYNGTGHIWSNATGEIADAVEGKGGFMILLGNPAVSAAQTAQVYTFPTKLAKQAGDIELSVEIEVTAANCGKDIEAQSLQTMPNSAPEVHSLDLAMPDCDAVGDFLVLKNLLNDLKVASATN